MDTSDFEEIASALRYHILQMTHRVSSGHPTSSFSAVELLTMLFFKHLRFDLSNPENSNNDRFILSKGHASALYYALFALAGAIDLKDLDTYRLFGSSLEGHPTYKFSFTEAAGGSLGQGLAIGAGEALGIKNKFRIQNAYEAGRQAESTIEKTYGYQSQYDATIRIPFSTPRVFVLMGDGEVAEGSVWEAAAFASKQKLDNLISIVDMNKFGQYVENMHGGDAEVLARKFEAFGWATIIIDGHDINQIDSAYEKAICYKKGPSVIIGRTVKGKGIPLWENKNGWHNKMLPSDELEKALLKFKPKSKVTAIIQKPEVNYDLRFKIYEEKEILKSYIINHKSILYDKSVPTKLAFGSALVKIGKIMPNLIVLDADVANSLHTDKFKDELPDQFIQNFISEQTMAGVSIGLAKMGYKPVINTFAAFLSRAHDQFRMMPLNNVNVIVNGSYSGVSVGRDGPSQFGLEDLAMFRSIYGSTVLYPCDPYQTERLVSETLNTKGIVYVRTTREPTPVIYSEKIEFHIGGSYVHQSHLSNQRNLITIISAGITVHEALKAQIELEKQNVPVQVIDSYSVKPIDKDSIVKAAKISKTVIVVEDHYPEGGLGEAVKTALSEIVFPIYHLAVTKLPMSGSPQELLKFEEIDAEAIYKLALKVRSIVAKPKL